MNNEDRAVHPYWNLLIEWLSGHGMDISQDKLPVQARSSPGAGYGLLALRSIEPSTPLFSIPAKALLNSLTLEPHYPPTRPKLTCTQFVSLHLLLHRPMKGHASSDPLFGPYISVLPRDFDSHPLTWLWKKEHINCGTTSTLEAQLVDALPSRILVKLDKIANLFEVDFKRIQAYLQSNPTLLTGRDPDVTQLEPDYLWAWLNVNTRCVYHRLAKSRSNPDNMTLCPILDFANHTISPPYTMPKPTQSEIWDTGPLGRRKFGDNFVLLSPSTATTSPHEEIFLRYGPHSNSTLFAEYGFVMAPSPNDASDETSGGEIELQGVIETLFLKRGSVGSWMKEILVVEGYWGDWTMHCTPKPAHPSYRLITALRIYHLLPLSTDIIPSNADHLLEEWRNTTLGKRTLSPQTTKPFGEQRCCKSGEAGINRTRKVEIEIDSQNPQFVVDSAKVSIETLWREEIDVATAVMRSLENNEEF
ncbi:hypothetical protein BDZ97DRAFT_1839701 [Flammula alnicola]|nr:hypothetical protein BDZ97DRAFT_1839701 [Flammula alnicola]